jgi:IS1 family transposase
LLDWAIGNRGSETLKPLLERLNKKYNPYLYCSDGWSAYSELIPKDQLVQSKSFTYRIEQNNSNTRNWLSRFKRKSKCVSHSKQMIDVDLRLVEYIHAEKGLQKLQEKFIPLFT